MSTKARTVYLIRSLQGYRGTEWYDEKAQEFTRVGFVRCRSEPGPDGKWWEVWLGYPFMLKDELLGKDRPEIEAWLRARGPGEISVAVEVHHLGLMPD